jgi:two-component system NarL family response regulator
VKEAKPAAIRILLAEGHPVVADGIAAILATARDMVIVGRAANGVEAIELLKRHEPDIALLDLRMPLMGGLEVARWISRSGSATRTVVLTSSRSESDRSEAMRAGARAYLLKDTPSTGILETIRRVHRAKISNSQNAPQPHGPTDKTADLKRVELEILELILQGDDNRTIGVKLGLRTNAVKYLLRGLYSKLGVKKRGAAARQAIERGLIRDNCIG